MNKNIKDANAIACRLSLILTRATNYKLEVTNIEKQKRETMVERKKTEAMVA